MIQTPAPQSKPSRPKRVITEARKLQNREAQRAYRQRQKERAQNLRRPALQKGVSSRYRTIRPSPAVRNDAGGAGICAPTGVEAPHVAQTSVSIPGGDGSQSSAFSSPPRHSTQTALPTDAEVADIDLDGGILDILFPETSTTESSLSNGLFDISNHQLSLPPPPEENACEEVETSPSTPPSNLGLTPYRNTLKQTKTHLLSACYHNVSTIGMSIEAFFTMNCFSLCSPFYRPATVSDDPKALLETVTASVPFVPANLRPTLPQILIPHHPIFDLIPIPVLRSRAIILSTTVPHLVNIFELKQDIFEGGLVCWGLGEDVMSLTRRGSGSGSGHPWDLRSWRVAPWFFDKWKMLLSGDAGDFWG
ncbi:uncharacterized protein BJX67DRAFT_347396 [Aspergillus lucknowensis]|uniref:BZIP domain-containing protein n=1 Tax=Aspergillus lucknowensis TaxID=176173 RepID=A0ABR4LY47_9EURO